MAKQPKIWLTSDWHFNHYNIIKYCNRPFDTVEEMNYVIVYRYNEIVGDNDICYVLGDVGMGELKGLIGCLKGTKILIRGNHDKASIGYYLSLGFAAVLDSAEIIVGHKNRKRVKLRHIPARSPKEFLYLCWVYTKTMRNRKRSWREVFNRLRREYRHYIKRNDQPVLCGHVHERWKTRNNNINVGVDVRGFRPVSLKEALDREVFSVKREPVGIAKAKGILKKLLGS